jgi:hypothetical protein
MTYYFDVTDKYDYAAITHHHYPSFVKQRNRRAAEILSMRRAEDVLWADKCDYVAITHHRYPSFIKQRNQRDTEMLLMQRKMYCGRDKSGCSMPDDIVI